MLDRATIRLRRPVLIRPEVVTQHEVFLDRGGYRGYKSPVKTEKNGKFYFRLRLFHGSLILFGKVQSGTYALNRVELNPVKLLRGHNGWPLRTSQSLVFALTEYLAIMRPLLVDADDDQFLLPGLERSGRTHWSKLEIPTQIWDPARSWLSALINAKHPRIQKAGFHVPGESVKKQGTSLSFGVYSKTDELAKTSKNEGNSEFLANVTRLEFSLSDEKLPAYLGSESNSVRVDEEVRLVAFSMHDLRAAFRRLFGELQGIRAHSFSTPDGKDKIARIIAWLCREKRFNLEETVSNVIRISYSGATKKARRKLRAQSLKELGNSTDLQIDYIATDYYLTAQALLRIPALETAVQRCHFSREIDPRVQAVYGAKADFADPFIPVTAAEDLEPYLSERYFRYGSDQ